MTNGQNEFYAKYTFATLTDSFRFQLCELGDFDKYDYEIIVYHSITQQTSLYLRFGDSTSDLDTYGANARIAANFGTGSGNGTIESYQAVSNYALFYNRYAGDNFWGNINLNTRTSGVNWTSMLGSIPQGDVACRIGMNTLTSSNITHARLYVTSGTFGSGIGYLTVYRRRKE